MKTLLKEVTFIVGFLILLLAFIAGLTVGADISYGANLALKATWTPNTDTVTIGYRLYRTDGTRTLVVDVPGKTPTFPVNFSITVPDNSAGTATFVVVAYSATKVSGDSNTANYPFDLTPVPQIPVGLGVSQ